MGQSSPSAASDGRAAEDANGQPVRVREAGDGDCLFHALARQCLGDTALAPQLRAEVCDWMCLHLLPSKIQRGESHLTAQHLEEIASSMSDIIDPYRDDASVLEYICGMRRQGTWGSGLEALCAAYRYNRTVSIWCDSLAGPPASTLKPPHVDASQSPVGLLHVGNSHWDSVVLPLSWSCGAISVAFRVFGAARPTAEEVAADCAFLDEDVPPAAHDASRSEDQRRVQREYAAARFEKKAQHSAPQGTGRQFARRMPASTVVAATSSAPPFSSAMALPPSSPSALTVHTAAPAAAPTLQDEAEERRALRERIAARYEAAGARTSVSRDKGARPKGKGFAGADKPQRMVSKPRESDVNTSEKDVRRQRLVQALVRDCGLSEAEALEALMACGGDIDQVRQLHGMESERTEVLATPSAAAEISNRQCTDALKRVGLSEAEALDAMTACDGDIDKLKRLYCIDWDQDGSQTTQAWFH